MNESISKSTILVLVILTVVISLLGTWTVLNEVNSVKVITPESSKDSTSSGEVRLTVIEPPEPVQSTGQVVLSKIK